jgi:hypothetical protein
MKNYKYEIKMAKPQHTRDFCHNKKQNILEQQQQCYYLNMIFIIKS